LQGRASWIAEALTGDESFPDGEQRELDPAAALAREDFVRDVPEALYWLLRSMLVGEDERARELCARLAESPSRMLRDAAAVVAEILAGTRRSLGVIDDLAALRARQKEHFADPDGFNARAQAAKDAAHEAERQAEVARVIGELGVPLTMQRLPGEPAGIVWQGLDNGGGKFALPGGGLVRVGGGVWYFPPGTEAQADVETEGEEADDDDDDDDEGKAGTTEEEVDPKKPRALTTVATVLGQIESASLRDDGKFLLTSTSSALFEISLPDGATNGAWWDGVGGGTAVYLTHDRVLVGDAYGQLQLFERRGSLLVPGAAYLERTGGVFGLLAGGRIALAGSGDRLALVGIYGDRLAELAVMELGVERVGLLDGRAVMRDTWGSCWELGGLDAVYAAKTPAPWQAPAVPRAQRLPGDPRPQPEAAPAGTPWPDASWVFVTGGRTFAMVPSKKGHDLVWEAGGKPRRLARVPFEPRHPRDRGLLHVQVSPGGGRALVWRNLDSFVRVIDLEKGKLIREYTDDPGSGMVKDACWLDDDHFAWAHWQSYVQKVGEDEPALEMDESLTSIAAAPGIGPAWLVVGVQAADADGPQRLVSVVIDDFASDNPMFYRKGVPLPERLATVRRVGDDLMLQVGDAWWKFDPVDGAEEPPEDEDDSDGDGDGDEEDDDE